MQKLKQLLSELKDALTKESNKGLGIYLFMNFMVALLLVGVFITYLLVNKILMEMNIQVSGIYSPIIIILAIPITATIYLLGLLSSLTKMGEWILRKQLNAKIIKGEENKKRLYPIYDEVYRRVVEIEPNVSKNIKLFISYDEMPNAFAAGQNTIILTTGLLQLDDEQIKGIIAHEFAHIVNKDTTLLLLTKTGNIFFNVYAIVATYIAICLSTAFTMFSSQDRDAYEEIKSGVVLIKFVLVGIIEKILNWGYLFALKSSRENEFEADKFATRLGYGRALAEALDIIAQEEHKKSEMERLKATHPETSLRIEGIAKIMNGENIILE